MSTEPEYNFNEPAASESAGSSIALPFALISVAVAIFLIGQTLANNFARNQLGENKTQLIKSKKDHETARTNREGVVKQAIEIQAKVQALLTDLIKLADKD